MPELNLSQEWTLAEGIQKLFSEKPGGEIEMEDLVCYEQHIHFCFDISFSLGDDAQGISVMLMAHNDLEGDEDHWYFSTTIYPRESESRQELIARVAQTFGVKPGERVWENGDLQTT